MKPPQWLGAGMLASVVAIVLVLLLLPDSGPAAVVIRGHVGNLKVPYFENPEVQRILREKVRSASWRSRGVPNRGDALSERSVVTDGVDFLFMREIRARSHATRSVSNAAMITHLSFSHPW